MRMIKSIPFLGVPIWIIVCDTILENKIKQMFDGKTFGKFSLHFQHH